MTNYETERPIDPQAVRNNIRRAALVDALAAATRVRKQHKAEPHADVVGQCRVCLWLSRTYEALNVLQ